MLAFAWVLAALFAPQQTPQPSEPTVVFVCEHGAAKRVIATAYFNKIAAEAGLRARAIYRGVNPQDELSVLAMKGLKGDGLRVDEHKPILISQADVNDTTVIFAIGCMLPASAAASGKVPGIFRHTRRNQAAHRGTRRSVTQTAAMTRSEDLDANETSGMGDARCLRPGRQCRY